MSIGVTVVIRLVLSLYLFRYHLRDIVVGKIYFLLVRIKIRHMEIAIIKKETSGSRKPWYYTLTRPGILFDMF